MTGFLLIGVCALWIIVSVWIGQTLGNFSPDRPWRPAIQFLIVGAIIPLPLIDEIVGGWQFSQLCKQHDSIYLNRETARGKTVYFAKSQKLAIGGMWVPVVQKPKHFLDVATNEPVLAYERFDATGGVFIRSLGISEGNAPLTFPSSCEPGGLVQYNAIFRDLDIKVVERETTLQGPTK